VADAEGYSRPKNCSIAFNVGKTIFFSLGEKELLYESSFFRSGNGWPGDRTQHGLQGGCFADERAREIKLGLS